MSNGTDLKPLGTTRLKVKNPKTQKKYSIEFVVGPENLTPLIGARTAQQMELMTVHQDNFVPVPPPRRQIDENAEPSITPSRRVPTALGEKFKAELDRLESLEVLTKVDEPTAWVSSQEVWRSKDMHRSAPVKPSPKERNTSAANSRRLNARSGASEGILDC